MRSTLANILTALCCTLVIAGSAVLVGVWAVPQWDAYQAETQFTSMQATASGSSSSPEGSRQLSEALSYNASLAGSSGAAPSSQSTPAAPYDEQLTLSDDEAIGWVEIPSIDVRRPLFHYDNEEVLMAGLGHIEGTSLPVGGESTHCVITGHSGMPGSRMLDDLRKVEVGDVFVLWTLGDPYAYRVYETEVVEPDDVSSLGIQKGRDLATILTCTPYGVNSHRLLVHGERTAYSPEEIEAATHHPTSDRLVFLAGGILAAAVGVGVLLYTLLGGGRALTLVGAAGGVGAGQTLSAAGMKTGEEFVETQLKLKSFHRASLSVDGVKHPARWHRSGGDVVVQLLGGQGEGVSLGGAGINLPKGSQLRLVKEGDKLVMNLEVNGVQTALEFE